MIRKIISCLIALTFVFGMLAFGVSADTRLEIKAIDTTVEIGQDVVVQICITTSDISYFAFNVEWDKDLLTYKSYEWKEITSWTATHVYPDDGYLEYQTLRDANAETVFDDTVILEITFTATDDIGDNGRIDTPVNVVVWSDEDEAYADRDYNPMMAAEVSDVDGTVTILTPHEVPVVDVNIDGSGKVGEELTADVDVWDNWGLDIDLGYSWTIDGVEVSDEAAYTPSAGDLGKEVVLSVTATVDADVNPSATGTDSITVIKNDGAKPGIILGEVLNTVRAGADAVICYTYSDLNGIADASYANVYIADSIDGEYSLFNSVLADNATLTFPTNTDICGKFIKLEVIPKNVDGDEGNAVITDPIEVVAPSVSAENITVFAKNNVYGFSGYKLIKVTADIDVQTGKITVGNAQLYYSPDKNAFYGVVSADDVGGQITPENIAYAANILDDPSPVFYFGRPSNPSRLGTGSTRSTAVDLGAAKKLALGTANADVDVYLASDVNNSEPDGNITALDISAIRRNALNGETLPVLR